tara:strand:- start:839 stop:1108 length:270 start_codon:yes stop_codon:yes gene_type:complete
MLLNIVKLKGDKKKYQAVFSNKRVKFGAEGSKTFLDHKDDKKKENYLKRHIVRENWNDPYSAGALSRYILWNKPTLLESIKDYKKRFGF